MPAIAIVLIRNKAGAVFALEDRCAHRQVPLSCGVVEGDAIRCGYHGWAYDRSGKCTDVPYLGKGRLPNGVRGYPCREAGGMIFVFPGDPALGRDGAIPAARRGGRFRLQDPLFRPHRRPVTTPSCTRI